MLAAPPRSTIQTIMKLICSSPNSADLGLFQGQLEVAGIASELRNECSAPNLVGGMCDAELWVLDDADFPAAVDLLHAWRAAARAEG
jgi:hypothetical protein